MSKEQKWTILATLQRFLNQDTLGKKNDQETEQNEVSLWFKKYKYLPDRYWQIFVLNFVSFIRKQDCLSSR